MVLKMKEREEDPHELRIFGTWKKSKFDISMHGKAFVLRSIGKKWKDYKAELKSEYYYPYSSTHAMSNCPNEVISSQWEWLVAFGDSAEGKNRSARNRRNLSLQKYSHTGGSKSNARLRHEMATEMGLPEGEEPSKSIVWIRTHKKKNGNPINEDSRNAIEQLETTALERSQTNGDNPNPNNEDFESYFGPERHGYVRTYGLGVAPSKLGRKRKPRSDFIEDEESDIQNEIVEIKSKYAELKNKNTEMEQKMERILSMLPANFHHLGDENDSQVNENTSPP